MHNSLLMRQCAAAVAVTSMALVLAACNGGGSSTSSTNPAPTLVTVSEYMALRANTAQTAASATPDTATLEAQIAASRKLAVGQLWRALSGNKASNNVLSAPPLTYMALRTLGAAASGDSLAELGRSFDLNPSSHLAAEQTGRVASRWWADHGRQFRTGFLSATDAIGAPPRLSGWSAAETGFADGSVASDVALTQALAAAGSGLSLDSFSAPINIRLLATHTLNDNAGWDAVTAFEGVFAGTGAMVRLPMLHLTSGATRYGGADYTADLIRAGNLHVMTLRPSSASLSTFAGARLESALTEAVQALMTGTAVPTAGDMLLPQGDISLWLDDRVSLSLVGVNQVYDETLANLKNLDGQGGTFAQTKSAAKLHIGVDGLTLQAAHAMAFTFSSRNVNGPANGDGFASVGGTLTNAYPDQTCTWPVADLNSFFLVILDTRGWIVSLAAIQSLPGTPIAPTCTASPGQVISAAH